MVANRSVTVTLVAGVAAILTSGGCGGGEGDDGRQVTSEALASADPAECVLLVEVDTGSAFTSSDEWPGVKECVTSVYFQAFDSAGNEIPIARGSFYLVGASEARWTFGLRACMGQMWRFPPALEPFIKNVLGPPSLFLFEDTGSCPTGTTVPGDFGDLSLSSPLEEVSCESIGRFETHVMSCED